MERGANPRSVRQILFELVEDPTVRGQRRRYRRDRVFLAQYRQPPRERRPVTGLATFRRKIRSGFVGARIWGKPESCKGGRFWA